MCHIKCYVHTLVGRHVVLNTTNSEALDVVRLAHAPNAVVPTMDRTGREGAGRDEKGRKGTGQRTGHEQQ